MEIQVRVSLIQKFPNPAMIQNNRNSIRAHLLRFSLNPDPTSMTFCFSRSNSMVLSNSKLIHPKQKQNIRGVSITRGLFELSTRKIHCVVFVEYRGIFLTASKMHCVVFEAHSIS